MTQREWESRLEAKIFVTGIAPVRSSELVERSRSAAEERKPNEASHGSGRVVMFFGVDFPDSG